MRDSSRASNPNEFTDQCLALDLDPQLIRAHRERVRLMLKGEVSATIPLVDTCRITNGGILPAGWSAATEFSPSDFISFVPAAGASSRYFRPLAQLRESLDAPENVLKEVCDKIASELPENTPLPDAIGTLLANPSRVKELVPRLRTELDYPKAFLPCVVEGKTFLEMKLLENQALKSFSGEVFICNPKHQESFLDRIPRNSVVLVQGPKESTIRFDQEGEPIYDSKGCLSAVPAGHGTLVNLIREAGARFPTARSAIIRNVDNVMGTHPEVIRASHSFFCDHQFLLERVVGIRQSLDNRDEEAALQIAQQLLLRSPRVDLDDETQAFLSERSPSKLWEVQCRFFHLTPSLWNSVGKPSIESLFKRPVNSLGMVPNTESNVGGSPAFVQIAGGRAKICLEAPHVSQNDCDMFLRDPDRSTHFNPVFVAAEMNFPLDQYRNEKFASWLIAEKTFEGKATYYHESILYELLGNNILSNCVFREIPRTLFNPHKTLSGSAGRRLSEWLD